MQSDLIQSDLMRVYFYAYICICTLLSVYIYGWVEQYFCYYYAP